MLGHDFVWLPSNPHRVHDATKHHPCKKYLGQHTLFRFDICVHKACNDPECGNYISFGDISGACYCERKGHTCERIRGYSTIFSLHRLAG